MADRKPGDKVGKWELLESLGKGGNGEVWKVRAPDKTLAAMKISTKPKASAFERFKAEVHIHLNHSDVPGVMKVIEYSVSVQPEAERRQEESNSMTDQPAPSAPKPPGPITYCPPAYAGGLDPRITARPTRKGRP